jgi:hypothetical protein
LLAATAFGDNWAVIQITDEDATDGAVKSSTRRSHVEGADPLVDVASRFYDADIANQYTP